jgi:putative acetyltransferase
MIRKFRQSDLDQVITIWLEASIIAHDFIDSAFWKSKTDDMRHVYIPSSETYVFEESDIIKGFVSLSKDTIAALFVSPGEQGSGIGQQLMAKSKEVRDRLNLKVYKENVKSIEFYRKCGFKILKEQIDEQTGHPEWVMSFDS